MSKMSELSAVLDELVRCGEDLIRTANEIREIFSEPAQSDTHTEEKKDKKKAEAPASPKKEIPFTDVRALLAEKSRAGHTAAVKDLLQKYGAGKLSEIDPANYEALMADAEVLGNG